MAYALYHQVMTRQPGILRTSDNVYIVEDPESADWQAYLAWRAEGNRPTPLPPARVIGTLSDPDANREVKKEILEWPAATSSPTATAMLPPPSPTEPPPRKDPADSAS